MNNKNKIVIFVSIFAALTSIGAYLKIPLPHVPITLQTFFVIMSGNLLGFKLGALSQILYLTVGLLGIPIFAYGGGPGYVFQPTFGYLLGYPWAAFVIGLSIKLLHGHFKFGELSRVKIFCLFFIADMLGVLTIFVFGIGYLFLNLKLGLYLKSEQLTSLSLAKGNIITTTLILFIPIDLVKALLASWVTIQLRRLPQFQFS